MGARWGCKNLKNISEQLGYDITDHGMKASYLCGGMFGLRFRRHRLFETNWMWLVPSHSKHHSPHQVSIPTRSGNFDPYYREKHPNPVNSEWRQYHDGGTTFVDKSGRVRTNDSKLSLPTKESGIPQGSLAQWQGNGAQKNGVGVGHAVGWKLAAEAMGIDWMKRGELTQAIPPVYTEHIGTQLMRYLKGGER